MVLDDFPQSLKKCTGDEMMADRQLIKLHPGDEVGEIRQRKIVTPVYVQARRAGLPRCAFELAKMLVVLPFRP